MPAFERNDSVVAEILQEITGHSAMIVPYRSGGFLRSFKILTTDGNLQVDRIDFDKRDSAAFKDPDPHTWSGHLEQRYGSRLRQAQIPLT
jgi:hypothetical protein